MTRRARRGAVSVGCALMFVAIGYAAFGEIGLTVSSVLALIVVTARHDNALGTCLPLVILALIVVAIMALPLFLVAIDPGGSPREVPARVSQRPGG